MIRISKSSSFLNHFSIAFRVFQYKKQLVKIPLASLLSLFLSSGNQSKIQLNTNNHPPTDLKYWAKVMNEDPSNAKLNSFTFEEKYKIIEYAYNEIGIKSAIPFEKIEDQILKTDPWEDIFNEEMQINRIAYWILGFWGTYITVKDDESAIWIKPSKQIWFYDGEQDELNYLNYVTILHQMRETKNEFNNEVEVYDKESKTYKIKFEYNAKEVNWEIDNNAPGWLNGMIFKLYAELCEDEYIVDGNYFTTMEGQGAYVMYLTYDAEEYLRKLWDFPKLNSQGKMMNMKDYGRLFDKK